MKRLLMIIPFFPPTAGGGVYRPLSFVKYLGRYGWQTTVIAPRGDAFWINDPALEKQIPASCTVVRTPTLSGQAILARMRGGAGGQSRAGRPPQKRSSGLFSIARKLGAFFLVPDTYVGWRPYANRAVEEALDCQHFDAIYSTSPPETTHLIALAAHKRTGLPWVADFRDPWMNLHLLDPPTPLHAALHRRLERRICRRAHVVVATRWHEKHLLATYDDLFGITRLPNGFDAEEVDSVSAIHPPDDRFRIVHAGMLTQKRTAIPFLRGLSKFLEDRPDARARIEVLFAGAREDRNERACSELGLEDVVEFRDTIPHHETLRLERSSHILLLIKHVNTKYRGMVPGKLYEYIGLRRPILALAPEGEAADLVENLDRGLRIDQEDEAGIVAAITRLFGAFERGTLDGDFDLSARPELTRDALAGEMANLLDEMVAKKTREPRP
jgi:hypothetical protein